MKIGVFGLGYVGCVTAACFADLGHNIIGVDIDRSKVELINNGISPIVEKDVPELIKSTVKLGKLEATCDASAAVAQTDLCFVCVGTPSIDNGNINLEFLKRVSLEIGSALEKRPSSYSLVYRSTMLPGTMESLLIPLLEKTSGKTAGKDFHVFYNPEFLREGTSLLDFYEPPKTVIGCIDPHTSHIVSDLFHFVDAPCYITTIKTAELIKYANNAFHALKVAFTNEIGRLCKVMDIDSWELMDIFCQDTKLNISSAYLRPGYAFGGSCLPKDLRALIYKAKIEDLELPLLNSILPSNDVQIRAAFRKILSYNKRNVGFLGFSFKTGTDDLRESPYIALVELLLGKGYSIALYDKYVNISKLVGANRDYLKKHLPHVDSLMKESPQEVINHSDIVVVCGNSNEYVEVLSEHGKDKIVFDLVRLFPDNITHEFEYEGLVW